MAPALGVNLALVLAGHLKLYVKPLTPKVYKDPALRKITSCVSKLTPPFIPIGEPTSSVTSAASAAGLTT